MRNILLLLLVVQLGLSSCTNTESEVQEVKATAESILSNPKQYPAICFGGYRYSTRDTVPTVLELKEDLSILSAMGIKIIRTYNTQQFTETKNLLTAISEMKKEDANFEMYLMLGTWIGCEGQFSENVNHEAEDLELNTAEVNMAIEMVKQYPDIIKVVAVGNEAMVHWAATYFVKPNVILKYVDQLQELKKKGELPADLWITSSDNFASWGGESDAYHNEGLVSLIKAVDYVSMHTYPFHDTHYNPAYWQLDSLDETSSKINLVDKAMERARDYAVSQFESTSKYVRSIDSTKVLHIGETGWSSLTNHMYGDEGSCATDEYKQKKYYDHMRMWSEENNVACFYFEIFDEPWKDGNNPLGSENHFGLIDIDGHAKYPIWDFVDQGVFDGITRGGNKITKSYNGDVEKLKEGVKLPPIKN